MVGTIASISEPFCSDCNRLRITADGQAFLACWQVKVSIFVIGFVRMFLIQCCKMLSKSFVLCAPIVLVNSVG